MHLPKIKIGDRVIGDNEPCFVIAEISINHNGELALAKKLVDAAIEAGADAVKFQKRNLPEIYQQTILDNPRHGEQGLQYIVPILQEFELSDEEFSELWNYCRQKGVMALCTPWDRSSVDLLERLGIEVFKVGSPDMTNFHLIEHVLTKGRPLIVSTGMSSEEEIHKTINFLKDRSADFILLHCISTYPATVDEMNLRMIHSLREWSGRPTGFSSHSRDKSVTVAAVAMGACIIERHLTLDTAMRGPDHSTSLTPDLLAEEIRQIRNTEKALGVPHRWITRGEHLNRRALGKSLVATRDIKAGSIIETDMITAKSPGLGISPQRIDEVIGQKALRNIVKDSLLSEEDFVDRAETEIRRPIDIPAKWGVVARLHDLDEILNRFRQQQPHLIEFHVSDRDLDVGFEGSEFRHFTQDFALHAPEYNHDILIDLCSTDQAIRQMSVNRIQQAINLAEQLRPYFEGVGPNGPKVIVHIGGMSRDNHDYDIAKAYDLLLDSIRQLKTDGVELLVENLPPYPWFFGGRWLGHILVDAETTAAFCAKSGVNLCFDTSHAMLECNRSGGNIIDFFKTCRPYIRHLHISDGAGVAGEGLQIGEGQINFIELLPLLLETETTLIPEIWYGHHEHGRGFQIALERLSEITWATKALTRVPAGTSEGMELAQLITPTSSTIMNALEILEATPFGIVFVVDEEGILQGIATSGDIHRALMQDVTLRKKITEIMNTDFRFAWSDTSDEDLKKLVSARFQVLPILDQARRLAGFVSYDTHKTFISRKPTSPTNKM